ncbi:TOMM precursor leader peptide-binding protein [Streptomyces sp. R08]|uniref:TOMM leader peptide-binding protein n=1 Tax=Streptomyces sp. R08 TaxID=3238624 RepID=A0AB39MRA1_9ACTN
MNRHIAVVGLGEFGQRVARLLIEGRTDRHLLSAAPPHEIFHRLAHGGAEAVMVVLWRHSPAWCDEFDTLAFQTGTRWLPVVMEHPRLRVGPLISPGQGPCHRCFERRRIQHDPHPEAAAALAAAYDAAPDRGPTGYLPHHARLAAHLAEVTMSAHDSAGRLTTLGLNAGKTESRRVRACHGCTRCSSSPLPYDGSLAPARLLPHLPVIKTASSNTTAGQPGGRHD